MQMLQLLMQKLQFLRITKAVPTESHRSFSGRSKMSDRLLYSEGTRDIIAGSIGGAASLIPSQPFDVVKTRYQTQNFKGNGIGECVIEITRKEGFRGLYKGMAFPLYGQVAVNAVVFGAEGFAKRWLPKAEKYSTKDINSRLLSGGFGGAIQSLVCSPMELVKISMQLKDVGEARGADYRGPTKEFKNIWRQGGIRGVYSGLVATTIRDSTGFAAYFYSYYMIRALYTDYKNISRSKIDDLPLPILSLAGGTAGCISWAVNYPVDIFKTLLQEDTIKEMLAKEKGELYHKEYTGIYDCAKKVLAQNGLRGYYRGIGPCLVRAFFNSCALLPTYTKVYNNWPWKN